MNIVQALKLETVSIRVNCNWRWLVYDTTSNEWVVYERQYHKRGVQEVIRTASEENAVACLVELDQETDPQNPLSVS